MSSAKIRRMFGRVLGGSLGRQPSRIKRTKVIAARTVLNGNLLNTPRSLYQLDPRSSSVCYTKSKAFRSPRAYGTQNPPKKE